MIKTAILSDDQVYRYELTRLWAPEKGYACWIMLNPSVADDEFDDRTIQKIMRYTERENWGGIVVVNLFAYRAQKPVRMWEARDRGVDIVGPENASHIVDAMRKAKIHFAAWGVGNRDPDVAPEIRKVHKIAMYEMIDMKCLGHNGDGSPKHPLYIAADEPLVNYVVA